MRAASVLGIVAGTLGVARHTAVVAALRAAAARAGKHAYVFVLGKLNPAKLANFAGECDVSKVNSNYIRHLMQKLMFLSWLPVRKTHCWSPLMSIISRWCLHRLAALLQHL